MKTQLQLASKVARELCNRPQFSWRPGWILRLLFVLLPALSHAQYTTNTNDDGTLTLIGYNGPGGAVTIPNALNGRAVVGIDYEAFAEHTNLTSVIIPHSVTVIGVSAFRGCTSLGSVQIGSSVTNIAEPRPIYGGGAFAGCISLTNFWVDPFNAGYSSLDGVLLNKTQDILITYPPGKMGGYIVPDGVTSIGNYAFANCAGLRSVRIPNNVTNIAFASFHGSALTNVTIGAGVTTIQGFSGCFWLTHVNIPTTATRIGNGAFENCYALTSLEVPDSVLSIGDSAFGYCIGLTNVALPDSVTHIGPGAFEGCSGLTSIRLPRALDSMDARAFALCAGLTTMAIPAGVTNISDSAFAGCNGITRISLPNSLTSVGDYAFANCAALATVVIPAGVNSIGSHVFDGCLTLMNVFFSGDAPAVFPSAPGGIGAPNAQFFYLPGRAGWSGSLGDRPAVLWNPKLHLGRLGAEPNRVTIEVSGTPGIPTVVEASTNLHFDAWMPVHIGRLTNGLLTLKDPVGTNDPARFYRVRSP